MKFKTLLLLIFVLNTILFSQCWTSVTGGTIHTLAIASDSTLWAWGDNSGGQLGDGSTVSRSTPLQVGERKDWVSVSAGFAHSVALTKNGTIYTWGFNSRGQLGNGTETMQTLPQPLAGKWRAVTSGASHVIAIKSDGTLWAWGSNQRAQAGRMDGENQTTPIQISSETNWVAITAGYYEGIALNDKGELYGWGHAGNPQDWTKLSVPTRIGTDNDWIKISAGLGITVAVKNNGTLWTWESPAINSNTGLPYWEGRISQVGMDNNWAEISVGYNYVLATKTNGTLWAWGNNSDGQIGDGFAGGTVYSPQQIGSANNWKLPEAGDFHGMALNQNGILSTWGANGDGQLGNQNSNVYSPQEIACPDIKTGCWKTISVGVSDNFTIALKDDGSLWAWGNNLFGQLGNGNKIDTIIPIPIAEGEKFKSISAGFGHNIALHEDGSTWVWGNNDDGELGDGTQQESLFPKKNDLITNATILATTATSSLIKTSTNEVYGFGSNTHGVLGNDVMVLDGDPILLPTVSHIRAWTEMVVGASHAFAIQNDGTLWQWGGSITGTPNQLGVDSDWKSVATSGVRHAAIKTNGTLWNWGNLPGNIVKNNPEQVGTDFDWKEVATGHWHVVAIKNNGTLWTFGENQYGMGNGSNQAVNEPIQLGTDNDWLHVYTKGRVNFALKKNGTLWAWGRNNHGQLGINNREDQYTPVEVLCSYDFITTTPIVSNKSDVKIYPNPTENTLFISGLQNQENTTIRVYNLTGNLILVEKNSANIDVQHLAAGVYILQLEINQNTISTFRFIKQ